MSELLTGWGFDSIPGNLNSNSSGSYNSQSLEIPESPSSFETLQTVSDRGATTTNTLSIYEINLSVPLSITNGGTGITSLGTSGQVLTVNSSGNGLTWTTVSSGGSDTLQDVTDRGNTTTNSITVNSITLTNALTVANGGTGLTSLGTSGQVLTVNPSGNGLTWTTVSSGGSDTLQDVTDRGNTTTNSITVNSITNNGSYTQSSGSISATNQSAITLSGNGDNIFSGNNTDVLAANKINLETTDGDIVLFANATGMINLTTANGSINLSTGDDQIVISSATDVNIASSNEINISSSSCGVNLKNTILNISGPDISISSSSDITLVSSDVINMNATDFIVEAVGGDIKLDSTNGAIINSYSLNTTLDGNKIELNSNTFEFNIINTPSNVKVLEMTQAGINAYSNIVVDGDISATNISGNGSGITDIVLNQLSNVNAPSPNGGQVLTWDSVNNEWIPTTIDPMPVSSYMFLEDSAIQKIFESEIKVKIYTLGNVEFQYFEATVYGVVLENIGSGGWVYTQDPVLLDTSTYYLNNSGNQHIPIYSPADIYTHYEIYTHSPSTDLGLLNPNFCRVEIIPPPPENDNFADAKELVGTTVVEVGTTVAATSEPNEEFKNTSGTDDYSWIDNSVWYKWTAPSDGSVNINTNNGEYSTFISVYTGVSTFPFPNPIQYSDYWSSGITFNVTNGIEYFIMIRSFDSGEFELNITLT